MIVGFADIGRIVDHHCLELIVRFVYIGRIDDHHCFRSDCSCFDISGIFGNYCLKIF